MLLVRSVGAGAAVERCPQFGVPREGTVQSTLWHGGSPFLSLATKEQASGSLYHWTCKAGCPKNPGKGGLCGRKRQWTQAEGHDI